MNKFLAIVILLTAAVCRADDVRVVNGISVNLQPIHDWDAKGKEDRPLPHWKLIKIQLLIHDNNSWPTATISTEGKSKTVFLNNVPKEITKAFATSEKLGAEFQRMKRYVDAERIRVRNLEAVTPSRASVDSGYGEQIRRFNIAAADLKTSEEKLEELSAQYLDAVKQVGNQTEYAMNTGKKYTGKEIWDCGLKKT